MPDQITPAAHQPWRDEAGLAAAVTWIAASIAIIVAAAGPLGYFWLSYQAEINESAIAARLHAAFVTQAIGDAGGEWRAAVSGLIEAELGASWLPEQRSIVDRAGATISSSGPAVAAPTVSQRAALIARHGQVGEVVVTRSLRPLLWRTLLVALVAAALGGAIYLSLRVLPLRALRRTLTELRRREAQGRELAEEQLRIVLDNSIEGIVVFQAAGRVVSGNQAVLRMLGYTATGLV